ncbi:VOC family protein [Fodinicola feengrottensis]|uniref:VOC family protein n=1 Tax=Fodinicola feengrottensis TaxID=435914 RepID=A0ABP4RSP9_9ACTN|nr:VOC family protein [Fodinicola feengrottensis]
MIDQHTHIRIARPSNDLAAVERFYVDGLGLSVILRMSQEHDLIMLGWPAAGWHLELVRDPAAPVAPVPTEEDLLVIYLDGSVPPELVERLVAAGGKVVPSLNPYWDTWGVTIADPDSYRLVLCTRSWTNA